MDVYTHEKEQIEGIKAWWHENRWYIVAGLVISAAVVGGWRFWQEHRQQQAEAASQKYSELQTQAAVKDVAALETSVSELQADYAGTPYAALGALTLAAAKVEAGDYAAAADALRWAMENTDDDELALVARLRLARVLLQQEQAGEAIALLDAVEPGKFAALYAELRGDALLVGGDRDGARAAYEAALAASEQNLGDRRLLQMKLDNLAMPVEQITAQAPATEQAAPVNNGEDGE